MATRQDIGILPEISFTYRFKFLMRDGAGVPVTGLTGGTMTFFRSKRGEGATSITPTISEVSAANMPGLYEGILAAVDLDTVGALALHVTAAGAEATVLFGTVVPRPTVER